MTNPITAISTHAFEDETHIIPAMIARLDHLTAMAETIHTQASQWAEQLRTQQDGFGLEHFLHNYGIETREGVALMCLAEALLRIPDSQTADWLIHDTLEGKEWREHSEKDAPWLIAGASWSLLLAEKLVDVKDDESVYATLHNLTAKLGQPVVRQALKHAMRIIGGQFVFGADIEEGVKRAEAWEKKNYRLSYDILGEGARSAAQAEHYMNAYRAAITQVGEQAKDKSLYDAPGISVKLSALHPRFALGKREQLMRELLPRLKELLLLAKAHNLSLSIDAEEANRFDIGLILFSELLADDDFAGWNGLGFVLQAYQKRAMHTIDYLRDLAIQHERIIPIRLVKGAYWDSEIKHAQMHGLPDYPVFTRKEYTDVSYLACADKILQHRNVFYPQFATHNARTIATIQAMVKYYNIPNDAFEFQRLHGMGAKLHDYIIGEYRSRIYAPIGVHKDLLAYLIRRLLENGANSSFVHLLMDRDVPIAELLADPITRAHSILPSRLAPPAKLYNDRKNSPGMDPGYLTMLTAIQDYVGRYILPKDAPAGDNATSLSSHIDLASKAFARWAQRPVEEHGRLVDAIGDQFEQHYHELVALLVHEAGKTIPDAIAEVREAIDMCRYYALQSRTLRTEPQRLCGPTGESNTLSLHPRGVFACISPWNFPLAIFSGQVVAALATGNSVIAKPASQTPCIARYAVALMHAAGIPKDVLHLAIGEGGEIGQVLTTHDGIAGIVFTGSVTTARHINTQLATRNGPIIPFIAETGGQNCMVVDSSALPEQAVDDIILSAFGSAGQRCSALRVLYVQEDIADDLITLLKGAMQALQIGNPADIATDVGPVIDQAAQASLLAHIEEMHNRASLLAQSNAPGSEGHFVAPHAFEINDISQLREEHFGPILHLIRYKASERLQVAEAINSTGYGLTFGIHSRVQDNISFFLKHVKAGNYYVNRSMIGAVVGVQPFGGLGLSGTGPKAGGPYYLLRFMHEHAVSINVAAIGGNIALLSGKDGGVD